MKVEETLNASPEAMTLTEAAGPTLLDARTGGSLVGRYRRTIRPVSAVP